LEPIVKLNISNGQTLQMHEVLVKIEDSEIQRKLQMLEFASAALP